MKNYAAMAEYVRVRAQRPDVRAVDVWRFVTDDDSQYMTLDQHKCRHSWAYDDTDRCYCQYCGLDGDA